MSYSTLDAKGQEVLEDSENRRIIMPSREEAILTQGNGHVCGECKYFSIVEGQKRMTIQRFIERLVKEQHWQTHHLCSPTNEIGLCGAGESGASNESMITGRMHASCEQFRPANGRIGR